MRLWISAMALSALVGCGATKESSRGSAESPPPHGGSQATLKPFGEAALGDRTTCPVSKEEFTVSEASPKVEHKGKTYYFCCAGCDTKFKATPEKYLQPGGA